MRGVTAGRWSWSLPATIVAAVMLGIAASPASAAPAVTLTGVTAGQVVKGTVKFGATASDAAGVTQAKWYVDGVEVYWDGSAPWEAWWNSLLKSDGTHSVFAKAANTKGEWGTSPTVSFVVDNIPDVSTTSGVAVTGPTAGATVAGTVSLGATASHPDGITQMKWYVDGVEVYWDGSAPWSGTWDSRKVADGTHRIFAKAATSLGLWLTSPAVTFTVANSTGSDAAPQPTGWKLVMSENFDGTSIDTSKWTVPNNWRGHNGNGLRDARALSVADGVLTITAQMLNGVLVSGALYHRHDQTYGRYEFRARTDIDLSGSMSGVVLTWPQSGNAPTDGENDIYETLWNTSRFPFYTFIHYVKNGVGTQYYFYHQGDGAQWQKMAMEWEPGAIRIYRNDQLVWTLTDTAAIPDVPHHLCLQLDAFKTSIPSAVRMQVDDVRVYARA